MVGLLLLNLWRGSILWWGWGAEEFVYDKREEAVIKERRNAFQGHSYHRLTTSHQAPVP